MRREPDRTSFETLVTRLLARPRRASDGAALAARRTAGRVGDPFTLTPCPVTSEGDSSDTFDPPAPAAGLEDR